MVKPCGVCGYCHEYENGEACGTCEHRKPAPSEKLPMPPPPLSRGTMKRFTSMFGSGYQTFEGHNTKGVSRIPNDPPKDDPDKTLYKSGSTGTTASRLPSSKSKGEPGSHDVKSSNSPPSTKVKDTRPTSEETPTKISVRTFVSTVFTSSSRAEATQLVPSAAPVTEEEIRNFLMRTPPVTVSDFLSTFMPRMKSHEEMREFANTVRRISKPEDVNGQKRVVLREK